MATDKHRDLRFIKLRLGFGLALVVVTAGCSPWPTVADARRDARSVTIVQNGQEPVMMSFRVVDAASYWSNYGSSIVARTGGGAASLVHMDANAVVAERRPTERDAMRYLYNNHPMAQQLYSSIIPELARAWGFSYDPAKLVVLTPAKILADKDGYLSGITASTDLVLTAEFQRLVITERPSLGGAFATALSLGMNAKNVTAESAMSFTAYRRDASGRYKRVWMGNCQVFPVNMDQSYPFTELLASPQKAKNLLDEATPKLIDKCKAELQKSAG